MPLPAIAALAAGAAISIISPVVGRQIASLTTSKTTQGLTKTKTGEQIIQAGESGAAAGAAKRGPVQNLFYQFFPGAGGFPYEQPKTVGKIAGVPVTIHDPRFGVIGQESAKIRADFEAAAKQEAIKQGFNQQTAGQIAKDLGKMRAGGELGSFVGVVGLSAAVEKAGQQIIGKSVSKAVAGQKGIEIGLKKGFQIAAKETPKFIGLGIFEGGLSQAAIDVGRGQKVTPERVALGALGGAVSAPILGVPILAGGIARGPLAKGISKGLYAIGGALDPSEPLGDVIAGSIKTPIVKGGGTVFTNIFGQSTPVPVQTQLTNETTQAKGKKKPGKSLKDIFTRDKEQAARSFLEKTRGRNLTAEELWGPQNINENINEQNQNENINEQNQNEQLNNQNITNQQYTNQYDTTTQQNITNQQETNVTNVGITTNTPVNTTVPLFQAPIGALPFLAGGGDTGTVKGSRSGRKIFFNELAQAKGTLRRLL